VTNRYRWSKWTQTLASFAFSSIATQVLSALSGILVIRALSKTEYAWFTIASGITAALNILSDAGLASAVTAIGGRIWKQPGQLASLVQRALFWRSRLTVIAIALTAPLSLFLLRRTDCPWPTALLLTALSILPIAQIAIFSIYTVVSRLHSRTRQLQVAEISVGLTRLAAVAAFALGSALTAISAMVAGFLSVISGFFIVRKQVLPLLASAPDTPEIPSDTFDPDLKKSIRQIYPNAAFTCVQGQLGVWLISAFATTSEVADFGALSRLALIFTAFNGPLVHAICPAFARCPPNPRRLTFILLASCGLVTLLSGLLLLLAATFPQALLVVLGSQYNGLGPELLWIIAMMGIVSFMQTIWQLNVARGWVTSLTWNIPIVICVQAITVIVLPINTIAGIALMSIIVASAQTVHASVVAYHGIRTTAPTPT
jgi:O-antigen/teichoic acid export membrane protein